MNTTTTAELSITTLPLSGRQLIEASAGTGKTYAVTLLVLRALLERDLRLEEILVVTFTEPATLELLERIHARLSQALQALDSGHSDDPTLWDLLSAHDPERCKVLISDALQNIDCASVYTIHGFCRRALQDSAFASGSAIELATEKVSDQLIRTLVADFWRTFSAGADPVQCHWWERIKLTPNNLYQGVRSTLSADTVRIEPEADPTARYQSLRQDKQRLRTEAPVALNHLLDLATVDAAHYPLKKTSLSQPLLKQLCEQLRRWLLEEALSPLESEQLSKLTVASLQAKLKKNQQLPDISGLERLESLLARQSDYEKALLGDALSRAIRHTRQALEKQQKNEATQGLDDLLKNLDQALRNDALGHLVNALRQRYKLAMIDEFQDTDHRQYAIFDRLFPIDQTHLGCITIGDPKQAIYRFRGADINTYLQARQDCPTSNHYTLSTNYRSCKPLIEALNAIYSANDDPFLTQQAIEYQPIKAAGRADLKPLHNAHGPLKPLVIRTYPHPKSSKPKKPTKESYTHWALQSLLVDIHALMQTGDTRLGDKPLQIGDLAILVRNNAEIAQVKACLMEAGIGSVSMGNTDVFDSAEVEQIGLWVTALAYPQDTRRLKALLLSSLGGLTPAQLQTQALDAEQLAHWQASLQRCQQRCLFAGPLPALLLWLREAQISAKLLNRPAKAGRQLTNLLHLAELLQASGERSPLLLMSRLMMLKNNQQESLQRLESDQSLVKIITIHKSKGLQFPLVFLPFAGLPPSGGGNNKPPFIYDKSQNSTWVIDIGSPSFERRQAQEQADDEAELQRLLYVALTRAEHRIYLYTEQQTVTAWQRLIGSEESLSAYEHFIDTPEESEALGPPGNPADWPVNSTEQQPSLLSAQKLQHPLPYAWQVHSYTSLSHGPSDTSEQPDYDRQTGTQEPLTNNAAATEADSAPAAINAFDKALDQFPKGAEAGVFLHALLEQIDFTHPEGDQSLQQALCQRHLIEAEHAAILPEWLGHIRQAQLPEAFCLADLSPQHRLDEMEFFLPFEPSHASTFSRLLHQHGLPCKSLSARPLNGFLKGFIDLCYRHNGRYYLADYKSNHLGASPSDYQQGALEQAMREHDYYLQAVIYTVALHRLLSLRLPNYRYEQHFGGVSYLFLRGLRANSSQGVLHFTPPPALILAFDQVFKHV